MDHLTSLSRRRIVPSTKTEEATPPSHHTKRREGTHRTVWELTTATVSAREAWLRLSKKKRSTSASTTLETAHTLLKLFSQPQSKFHYLKTNFAFRVCSDLVISAQHIGGPESFIIEIEKGKVESLLAEFDGDLTYLAQHLKLMNKRMVLINPVSVFETPMQLTPFHDLNSMFHLNCRNSKVKIPSQLKTKHLRACRLRVNK